MSNPIVRTLFALTFFALGCSSSETKPEAAPLDAGSTPEQSDSGAKPTSGDVDAGPAPRGACSYTNAFTQGPECVEYLGASWTAGTMGEDCGKKKNGAFADASPCASGATLGTCLLATGTDTETRVVFPGTDGSQCGPDKLGCETFGGGKFVPNTTCAGK